MFQDTDAKLDAENEPVSSPTIDSAVLENMGSGNVNVDIEDLEMLIDDDYEGPLKPTVEAAIQAKWNKIIGSDSEIIVRVTYYIIYYQYNKF